jgi:hypothetical protein
LEILIFLKLSAHKTLLLSFIAPIAEVLKKELPIRENFGKIELESLGIQPKRENEFSSVVGAVYGERERK